MSPNIAVPSPSHTVKHPLPGVLDILSLRPGQKFGSLEEQLVFLAQAFAREGARYVPVFNCRPQDQDTTQFTQRGIQTECIDLSSFSLRTLWQLRNLISRHRADLIQWNFLHPVFNSYLWSLRLIQPAVRHWYKDRISRTGPSPSSSGLKRLLKSSLMGFYQRVVCVSDYVQAVLESQGCTARNMVTQWHFVNTERFRPDAEARIQVRREQGCEHRFVLVAVGHLIADKGMDVAIRALALLPDSTDLWIIGEGPDQRRLEQLAVSLGLSRRVRLLGLQAQVQRYFQAADVFICPSLWAEAAGLVNIEAQACGLPILASRVGGIPEYMDEGHSGWLFEPGSAEQLAERVNRLLQSPELCRRMGEAARQMVLTRFSPESRIPDLLDLYRNRNQTGLNRHAQRERIGIEPTASFCQTRH